MKEIGRFDTDLQMFVEKPQPVRMDRLLFQRWLVDNNRGEHQPFSRPAGEFAMAIAVLREQTTTELVKRNVLVGGD
jgi:hypothetical protein